MYRAITLIELLTTLTIITIAIYFISPVIYHLSDHIVLQNEIDHIRNFIYHVQTQARSQKQSYLLSIAQNSHRQFCLIAIAKEEKNNTACNCFQPNRCHTQRDYFIYQSHNSVNLKSRSLYPSSFLSINGNTARLETKCLGIQKNNISEVIQFEQNGVVNVAQKNKRSECKIL